MTDARWTEVGDVSELDWGGSGPLPRTLAGQPGQPVHLHVHGEVLDRARPGDVLVLRVDGELTEEIESGIRDALTRTFPSVDVLMLEAGVDVTLVPQGTVRQVVVQPSDPRDGAGAGDGGRASDTPRDDAPDVRSVDNLPTAPDGSGSEEPPISGCGCRCSCSGRRGDVDSGCSVHGLPSHHRRYGRRAGCSLPEGAPLPQPRLASGLVPPSHDAGPPAGGSAPVDTPGRSLAHLEGRVPPHTHPDRWPDTRPVDGCGACTPDGRP